MKIRIPPALIVLLALVTLMAAPRSIEAGPFYPDALSVTMLGGPVVVCEGCEDNHLVNDIRFEIELEWERGAFIRVPFGGLPSRQPGELVVSFSGSIRARSVGSTAPDLGAFLGQSFRFPVLLELWESATPDHRSRTEGFLAGYLSGQLGLQCCGGEIAGVGFTPEFYTTLPFDEDMQNIVTAYYRGPLEAVPEPASVLLIGTGLAGLCGARCRRRCR